MLFASEQGEIVLCLTRIMTTEKDYISHQTKFYRFENAIHKDSGLYSLRLDDKDGDCLAIHCHNHHAGKSLLYFTQPSKIDEDIYDAPLMKFREGKVITEYHWISIQKRKCLVYVTRQLEVHAMDTEGFQVLFVFRQAIQATIPLLSILKKNVLELSAVQFFNVNTEVYYTDRICLFTLLIRPTL